MGKPKGPKGPEVGLVFPKDKKGGRYVQTETPVCWTRATAAQGTTTPTAVC